jgi:UDP-glucose 4-epimerase
MSIKRILVTGGAGFIGSHLVEALLKLTDVEVVMIIDHLSMGSLTNLSHIESSKLSIIKGDIGDYSLLSFILNKHEIDTVCHLAVSPLVFSLKEPKLVTNNIVGMQLTILECQRRGYFRKLISFSTSEVYGSSDNLKLTEKHRLAPRTPYAAAKAAADLLTQSYRESFKTDYTIIRPFNNYGPRKQVFLRRAGIIPTAIKLLSEGKPVPLFGKGEYARDFVFVEDTVQAVVESINSKNVSGEIINIATGQARTMREVVEDIARLMNVKPVINFLPCREGDVTYLCGDGSKANKLLGFTPKVSWEDGLKKCIEYYSKAFVSTSSLPAELESGVPDDNKRSKNKKTHFK